MYDDITAVILSGGKSSRMGTNKSFLKIGDKTLIERLRNLLSLVTSKGSAFFSLLVLQDHDFFIRCFNLVI